MNITEKILQKFTKEVNQCKWINTPEGRFLSVELNTHDLNEVTLITKEINILIDEIGKETNYYLDVHSKGVNLDINIDEISNYKNEKIEIFLNEPYKDKKIIRIIFLEKTDDQIFGKINNKGQFQKIFIKIENINKIQKVIF